MRLRRARMVRRRKKVPAEAKAAILVESASVVRKDVVAAWWRRLQLGKT